MQLDVNVPSTVLKIGLAYCGGVSGLYRRLVFLLFEKPLHAPLHLSNLAYRSEDNTGASYLESAVYSINWRHAVAGI